MIAQIKAKRSGRCFIYPCFLLLRQILLLVSCFLSFFFFFFLAYKYFCKACHPMPFRANSWIAIQFFDFMPIQEFLPDVQVFFFWYLAKLDTRRSSLSGFSWWIFCLISCNNFCFWVIHDHVSLLSEGDSGNLSVSKTICFPDYECVFQPSQSSRGHFLCFCNSKYHCKADLQAKKKKQVEHYFVGRTSTLCTCNLAIQNLHRSSHWVFELYGQRATLSRWNIQRFCRAARSRG